jgi:hypothetical protein
MRKTVIYSMCAFLLLFTSCNELEDITPEAELIEETTMDSNLDEQSVGQESLRVQKITGKGLKNLAVSGELSDGRTFVGHVSITELGYDEETGLWASGDLRGVIISQDGRRRIPVKESFERVASTLGSEEGGSLENARTNCGILFLDLGPLFLDVLGLQVDLSRIILDVTAVGGAGNLLGNLLCAVTGLLDPLSGLLLFLENLGQLLDLIGQINNLLG